MTPNDALLMTPHLWRNVDKNTKRHSDAKMYSKTHKTGQGYWFKIKFSNNSNLESAARPQGRIKQRPYIFFEEY